MRLLKLPLLAFFAAIALVTSASSCGKDPSFVFLNPLREDPNIDEDITVREIIADSVDLLWVIDNSGSMGPHQQNVSANTNLFMNEFISQGLNWKSGLISTDLSDLPFVGFSTSSHLDSTTANPITVFQNAVDRLGTRGSGYEKTFDPILQALSRHPGFLRSGVPLAILMVTDAPEQSSASFDQFYSRLRAIIGDRKLYVYGALNANDLGCEGETGAGGFGPWNYAQSPYETFVKSALVGKVFPLCATDFGARLASVGREIAQSLTRPTLFLANRPRVESIEIIYKGALLPGGPKEDGGYWMYDYGQNAIHFHDLNFATDRNDRVQLHYQRDDGLPAQ